MTCQLLFLLLQKRNKSFPTLRIQTLLLLFHLFIIINIAIVMLACGGLNGGGKPDIFFIGPCQDD